MVGYKRKIAGNLRQYLPDKPSHRWGFKIFVLAGKSGITYSFIPYQGESTFDEEDLTAQEIDLGVGASAVISLAKRLHDQLNARRTFDNWYTGLPLLRYLRNEMGILALGTVNKHRNGGCPLVRDEEFMAKGRGSYDFKPPAQVSRGRPSLDKSLSKQRRRILRPIPERPSNEMRLDGHQHFPVSCNRGRCRYCEAGYSSKKCSKCNMRFCMTSYRNCFSQFHIEK